MAIEDASLRPHPPSALPRGTRLAEFELRHVLGVGGFGIVYLAFDHALEREVAVKEYLPATLVGRTETLHVSLRSQSDAETFALGLKSFVNEARMLAHFDHPSLLKVLRFWEANGTAYMAMPVLRGHTVKEVRLAMAQPPDEAWVRAVLDPLLGAIERMHAEGVFHRDIAPDNIQIEPDGRPVLLDFGAARRVISDKSQSLTAILKPAYAPIEQYAEAGSVKQGPWTDLYALGATMHFLLLGRPPLPATARAVHDDLAPLSGQALPGCSAEFLNVIDWMLAPRPADRPQSVAAVRDVLSGRAPAPRRRVIAPVAAADWETTVIDKPRAPGGLAGADVPTMVLPRGPAAAPAVSARSATAAAAEGPRDVAPAPAPSRLRLVPVALGMAAMAVVAAVVLWPRQAAVAPPDLAASAAAPALAAASAAAPLVAGAASVAAAGAATVAPLLLDKSVAAAGASPTLATPVATSALPVPPLARAAEKKAAPTRPAVTSNVPTPPLAVPQAAAAAPTEAPQPARVEPSVPAPAPTAPPAPPPKALASGPELTCSGRNPVMYFVCMERECLRSGLATHADCQKWRQAKPNEY